ncbi:hypothetical protein JCM1840_007516 [Sporobolomyces johnsonii]
MASNALLGTPLPPRSRERSAAPSPITPAAFRRQPSQPEMSQTQLNPFSQQTASPLKRATPVLSTSPSASASNSPTLSQTDRASTPLSPRCSAASVAPPSEHDLRAEALAAVARTRILADPSISSAFRKDDDPELYALFVG